MQKIPSPPLKNITRKYNNFSHAQSNRFFFFLLQVGNLGEKLYVLLKKVFLSLNII
jgi:hypothetical protein